MCAPNSRRKRHRKEKKISANIPQSWSNWWAVFSSKCLKVKVTEHEKTRKYMFTYRKRHRGRWLV